MKFFSPAKICFLSVFVSVLAFSCSSPLVSRYYVQQQNKRNVLSAETTPDFSIPDGELPPEQELAPGQISMFSVILRDGNIAEPAGDGAVAAQLQGKLGGNEVSYTGYNFSSDFFVPAKISIRGISDKFPDLHYETSGAEWKDNLIEDVNGIYKQTRTGSNFKAEGHDVSNVVYRRIYGESPFKLYADARYEIYGEDGKPTGQYEPLMTRFMFYFFTGKTAVPALQNCLVAVDTYSKLVFQFGKPVDFETTLGNKVPTKWAPVDAASTGPGGKKYRFYQYDPVGYVTQDGSFHMTDTYKANLKNEIYDPVYTGKSPYVGYVGNAAGENNSYVISGTLTVKAKYLKNVSVTDALADHGQADNENWPEFIYGIRSRSYEGIAVPQWDILSSYKPDNPGITPSAAQYIEKGTSLELGGSKKYTFEGSKIQRTLELDARIIEIDIGKGENDEITDYEKPVVYLRYDGFSQSWKPAGTNDTYVAGRPIAFDKNFELAVGQTKDFVITLRAPEGQQMELCYELSWNTSGGSSEQPAFGVRVQKNSDDAQYRFTGENGVYTVEYRDTSDESAQETKTVSFALNVFNLKSGMPLKAVYSTENADFPLSPVFKAEDTVLSEPIFSTEKAVVDVSLSLPAKVGSEQNGKVIFTFTDENSAYDMPNSPDKIEITVIRRAYKIIPAAKLSISNPKLKNISIKDSHLSSKYQFAYTLKTAYNNEDWKPFSNSTKTVKINEEASLEGEYTWSVDEPHNDKHVVRLSAEIWEEDTMSANDVIIKHGKPVIELRYDSLTDSWSPFLELPAFFEDSDGKWEIKSVSMNTLNRNKKETLTITISAYIWESVKDWGDMELSFDVEWK